MKRLRNRRVAGVFVRAASVLSLLGSPAAGASELPVDLGSPEAAVRSLQQGLVAVAGMVESIEGRFEALEPLVRRTHDLEFIARLTVRRQWGGFSEEQQTRFIAAFGRLSIMTYASRFGGVDEETFRFDGVQTASAERASVSTAIVREDGEIPLDYTLEHSEDGWKIVNIVADGVSDLALKRAEYQRVLDEGSVETLIDYIDEQAAALP